MKKTKDSASATAPAVSPLTDQLAALHLPYMGSHYESMNSQAIQQHWPPVDYLSRLVEGELHHREERRIQRCIKAAHFPVLRTLEQFQWNWPKKINRIHVQELFRLAFIEHAGNVIFIGNVGVGKTHLSIALGYAACRKGLSVLFTAAVDLVNVLVAASITGCLKREMTKYLKPTLLIVDEVGYLPIDKRGADLLFQVIAKRYEQGSLIITTNRPYKRWPEIFNQDSTLTAALLDRLLHHADTILIEGNSYRMKDQIPPLEKTVIIENEIAEPASPVSV